MPEPLRLYLDQCLRLEVAEALRFAGHDVIRASDIDQDRADDAEILLRAGSDGRILINLETTWSFFLQNGQGGYTRDSIICRFAQTNGSAAIEVVDTYNVAVPISGAVWLLGS